MIGFIILGIMFIMLMLIVLTHRGDTFAETLHNCIDSFLFEVWLFLAFCGLTFMFPPILILLICIKIKKYFLVDCHCYCSKRKLYIRIYPYFIIKKSRKGIPEICMDCDDWCTVAHHFVDIMFGNHEKIYSKFCKSIFNQIIANGFLQYDRKEYGISQFCLTANAAILRYIKFFENKGVIKIDEIQKPRKKNCKVIFSILNEGEFKRYE